MKAGVSLRRYLLAGIVVPITLFVIFDTVGSYRASLAAIHLAYDRSLLASARSIGELLQPVGNELKVEVPFAALDIFDAGTEGRMYYRINGLSGEFLSGWRDLPDYTRTPPQRSVYPALVDFYDADYHGERVRMAALYQPVAGETLRGVALVQVAETQQTRERAARRILLETLMRQALLIAVVVAVAWIVVSRALRPVDALRDEVLSRGERDLSPVAAQPLPTELRPVALAINELMQRLGRLIGSQRQFVRDASHQLRTPLAVLKTQAQNGLSGHADAMQTLARMHGTVDRATRLVNQMLALAKVDQAQEQGALERVDLGDAAREVALDMAPLIAERDLEFELRAEAQVWVRAHPWMLREIVRNLLHNALRESPRGAPLILQVEVLGSRARLLVQDSGPGLDAQTRAHLFEPFRTGHPSSGSGLGLAICREICLRLQGTMDFVNGTERGRDVGLDVEVWLPLAPAEASGNSQIFTAV